MFIGKDTYKKQIPQIFCRICLVFLEKNYFRHHYIGITGYRDTEITGFRPLTDSGNQLIGRNECLLAGLHILQRHLASRHLVVASQNHERNLFSIGI